MTEQFVVGIVRGSHGLTGEFKVESTSGEYEHFGRMEEVTLTDNVTKKTFKVEETKEAGNTLYMKLAGINTPEDAANYNGWKIVVPRKNAHKLQKNEWYVEDLKGCSIYYEDEANIIGTVTDVKEGGSGYLVEILLSESCNLLADDVKFTKNGNIRSVFVPFKNEFIGTVNVETRMMQLMHLWILE